MRKSLIFLATLFVAAPLAAIADPSVPATSSWYFHADLDEMRSSDAGTPLYGWLDEEVFDELRDEVGIDLDKEAQTITAFSTPSDGIVMVLEGMIRQETQDKLLALAALADDFDTLKVGKRTFYYVQGDDDVHVHNSADEDDHDNDINGVYFSFDVKNKLIATSARPQMEALLASNGKIAAQKKPSGTMFVLTAEKSLMQAGMKPGQVGNQHNWDSNFLKNADQVAVMVADVAGKIAIEAQLIAKEAEMAEGLASIVRGLISLQAFNDELDPELVTVLRGTKDEV